MTKVLVQALNPIARVSNEIVKNNVPVKSKSTSSPSEPSAPYTPPVQNVVEPVVDPVVVEPTQFSDNFTDYVAKYYADGETFGSWTDVFGGYGTVGIESEVGNSFLHLSPSISTAPNQTSASLVVGPNYSGAIEFNGKILTVSQLRTGSAPNAWEVGWIIWNYTDNDHFYYFTPKPNGWELGKRDPNYPGGQRFLATGTDVLFPIGSWYTFKITQNDSNLISVWIDGKLMTTFTDSETPYTSGNIGNYTEDAHIHADDISTKI